MALSALVQNLIQQKKISSLLSAPMSGSALTLLLAACGAHTRCQGRIVRRNLAGRYYFVRPDQCDRDHSVDHPQGQAAAEDLIKKHLIVAFEDKDGDETVESVVTLYDYENGLSSYSPEIV